MNEEYEKHVGGLPAGELVLEYENRVVDVCNCCRNPGLGYELIRLSRREIIRRLRHQREELND